MAVFPDLNPISSFTVGGDFNKYYPVVFSDDGWDYGALELEISRSNVHTDSSWRGSCRIFLTWHSTRWGHGSDFWSIQVRQNKAHFLGGFKDLYHHPKCVLWLRGGGTTYNWRANHPCSVIDDTALDSKVVLDIPANSIHKVETSRTAPASGYGAWTYRMDSHPEMTVGGSAGTGIPGGMVSMWQGSTPPSGWALCDGQGGRPDLRGRFVLGAGDGAGLSARAVGQTGGTETHTLNEGEMPAHSHNVHDPGHDHHVGVSGGDDAFQGNMDQGEGRNFNARTSSSPTGILIEPKGGGHAHNNMPPYYVLAYIIKL